jgi:L-threonylcarbamoyladenylate synthase
MDAGGWAPRAADCLAAGGIVALPTETFYGLAVDPASAAAVRRLLALKGYRPPSPVLLLAGSVQQVEDLCRWSDVRGAAELAQEFWPGPLTLVLPLRAGRRLAACPGGSMAVRVPHHPVARELAGRFGGPISGTSANPAGERPSRTAEEVCRYFPRGLARWWRRSSDVTSGNPEKGTDHAAGAGTASHGLAGAGGAARPPLRRRTW